MKHLTYRIFQRIMAASIPLIPWPEPVLIEGSGSIVQIASILASNQKKSPLFVTTVGTMKRNSLDSVFAALQEKNITFSVFAEVTPDPTISLIENGLAVYKSGGCDSIVAVGGGSVIDCAKLIGARVARPYLPVKKMKGLFRIRKKLPLFIAVPTTAGTGSEATVAAVVSDEKTHYKYPVNDTVLLPQYAILDSELTLGLPAKLTAETGMDALTHAVEAYTNRYGNSKSRALAKKAVKMIFSALPEAYNNGNDENSRQTMLLASFFAGRAFTKAYVGYVHAIAHAMGGIYGVSHGLMNAILLAKVMRAYGSYVEKPLAELASELKIGEGLSRRQRAEAMIEAIEKLASDMGIPSTFADLEKKDYPEIAKRALKEANPLYPVPCIWGEKEIYAVLDEIYPKA